MTLYNPSTPKTTQTPTAIQQPVAQTVLSFGESVVASSSASTLTYSLPINITTGNNKVTAVQLEMQYDPNLLTNVSVTPGVFFQNPEILLNQVDAKTGRITYAFGIGPTGQGVVGTGTVATLNFSVNAGVSEKTAIIFLPKTLVTAEGVSESVLKEASVGQFVVGEN